MNRGSGAPVAAEIMREDLDHIADSNFALTTCAGGVGITLHSPGRGSSQCLAVVKNQMKGISWESEMTARILEQRYYKSLSLHSVLITLTHKGNSRNNGACSRMMEICKDVKRLLNEVRVKRLVLLNLE